MKSRNTLARQQARKLRIRRSLIKSSDRPRLHVHRTNQHLYAQIIDDIKQVTLVSVSENEIDAKGATKTDKAGKLGEVLATKAKKAKITKVVFDRGHYKYHGRVKALAESAKKHGLEF